MSDNDTTTRRFEYENSRGNARVTRLWVQEGDTVRETDVEEMFNYVKEQWETVHEHERVLPIDDHGRLIGDGSNWDGEGKLWHEYAEQRHEKRIRLRFPYDFDDVNEPVPEGGDKELVKEIAARNM